MMDQLEFEKLMAVAVRREVEAHEFYRDVAERVTDKSVKKIFDDLAEQEMAHHDLLEKFRFDPETSVKFTAPRDLKVAETVADQPLSVDMKPADAIALAMKKEQQAVEFYREMAALAEEAGVRDLFVNLSNMEQQHKRSLETVFIDIGYPESF